MRLITASQLHKKDSTGNVECYVNGILIHGFVNLSSETILIHEFAAQNLALELVPGIIRLTCY